MKLRYSPILEAGVVAATGPLLVFSAYLLLAGHNQPGGGFAGGLVAGTTILLAWTTGGAETVSRVLPIRSTVLMGLGITLAALTGFLSLAPGLAFLESGYVEIPLGVLGKVKLVSALPFDVGVYLVIVGMALGLVQALGEDESVGSGAEE